MAAADGSPPRKKRALADVNESLLLKRHPLDDPRFKWNYVRPDACPNLTSSMWNTITFVRGEKESWAPNRDDRMFVDSGAVHEGGKPVSVCTQYLRWYFQGGEIDPELVVDIWQRGKDLYFFIRERSEALDLMPKALWEKSAAIYGPKALRWQAIGRGFRDMNIGNAGQRACDRVELNISPFISRLLYTAQERNDAKRRVSAFLQRCPKVGAVRMTFFGMYARESMFGKFTLNDVIWDIIRSEELSGLLSRASALYIPNEIDTRQEPEDLDQTLDYLLQQFPGLHIYFERGITFRPAYDFESKDRIHSNDRTDAKSEEERREQWPTI